MGETLTETLIVWIQEDVILYWFLFLVTGRIIWCLKVMHSMSFSSAFIRRMSSLSSLSWFARLDVIFQAAFPWHSQLNGWCVCVEAPSFSTRDSTRYRDRDRDRASSSLLSLLCSYCGDYCKNVHGVSHVTVKGSASHPPTHTYTPTTTIHHPHTPPRIRPLFPFFSLLNREYSERERVRYGRPFGCSAAGEKKLLRISVSYLPEKRALLVAVFSFFFFFPADRFVWKLDRKREREKKPGLVS